MAPSRVEIRRLALKISECSTLTPQELDFLRTESQETDDIDIAGGVMSCFQWLNDPANITFVLPFLGKDNPRLAKRAVWTLCCLGYGHEIKDYLIRSVEPGQSWDKDQELTNGVPAAVGHHLSTHRDRDLAQLLIRWRPRDLRDPFIDSQPCGKTSFEVRQLGMWTGIGMGYAVGADALALTDDQDLVDASVARFLAERQDG